MTVGMIEQKMQHSLVNKLKDKRTVINREASTSVEAKEMVTKKWENVMDEE